MLRVPPPGGRLSLALQPRPWRGIAYCDERGDAPRLHRSIVRCGSVEGAFRIGRRVHGHPRRVVVLQHGWNHGSEGAKQSGGVCDALRQAEGDPRAERAVAFGGAFSRSTHSSGAEAVELRVARRTIEAIDLDSRRPVVGTRVDANFFGGAEEHPPRRTPPDRPPRSEARERRPQARARAAREQIDGTRSKALDRPARPATTTGSARAATAQSRR